MTVSLLDIRRKSRYSGGVPRVSVLMPCYNAASTLDEALNSLFSQSLADFEIVAVDDGSSDDTLARLQKAAARDARLKVLAGPHAGISAALNTGLAHCASPYVARMDADDRCEPSRLQQQASFLEEHPDVAVVSCQVQGFPEADVRQGFRFYIEWLNGLLSDADIRRELFIESPLPHPSVMLRRSALLAVEGYQEHGWPEDYDLWMRLYLAGARFAKLPQVLLAWREHPARLTRTDSRYSLENFIRLKAHYLVLGPLCGRDAVLIWGAGMAGRRLSKYLQRHAAPLAVFFDIDPRKIGRTRRGLPVLDAQQAPEVWRRYRHPALLVAVAARGARPLIRQNLWTIGLEEGRDWWFAA